MGTGAHPRGLIAAAIAAFIVPLLAGCGDAGSPDPSETATATGFQRVLGPAYPAIAPPDRGPRIDTAWLTRDRQSVFVAFIGGPLYRATDPCSEDYDGWAHLEPDRLDVTIVRVAHPEQPPLVQQPGQPIIACAAAGHGYLFQLRLPAAFGGSTVRDLGSGPLWVAPPDRVAELDRLPAGYQLALISGEPTRHELSREYRVDLSGHGNDDRYLALGQQFDGPGSNPIDAVGTIAIHGVDVPFGKNGDLGFIVSWPLGRDTLTLISYDRDLTIEAFAAMANGVSIPIH